MGAATEATARSAGGTGGAPSPRAVTRGEEKAAARHVCGVDWLNATFPAPSMSVEGFIALLGRLLGRPVSGVERGGLLGFDKAVKLEARHGAERSFIGSLAWGGAGQSGRWLFQLTGVGCAFVRDWSALANLLEELDSRITRVDLALDFFEGEYGVEDALAVHAADGFTFAGKMAPKTALAGDWLDGRDGRTLYVGKAQNGKMLRVYEKGRQLGDPDSGWVRFEVQLGNRDRVIPFEVLTEPDGFFAGCYPALADLVEEAARRIPTARPDTPIVLADLAAHMRRCYGKVAHALVEHAGASYAELVEGVRITALPRRLDLSSIAAGVDWADVSARMKGL